MLEYLEHQKKLTINQWKIFVAATIGDMLDFFDFLLIAFVLAFIVKDWNLTYGESGAILIRAWVPESPHWLIRVGRLAEARQSLAWALMVDPREIQLPAIAPPVEPLAWRELFKYPR